MHSRNLLLCLRLWVCGCKNVHNQRTDTHANTNTHAHNPTLKHTHTHSNPQTHNGIHKHTIQHKHTNTYTYTHRQGSPDLPGRSVALLPVCYCVWVFACCLFVHVFACVCVKSCVHVSVCLREGVRECVCTMCTRSGNFALLKKSTNVSAHLVIQTHIRTHIQTHNNVSAHME